MPDGTIMKAFLSLIAMVATFAVILFVVKKVILRNKTGITGSDLKILSRIHLQPKANLYIIQAEGKKLVIGVTDRNVSAIAEIPDQQVISSGEACQSVPMQYKIHTKPIPSIKTKSAAAIDSNPAEQNLNPLSFKSFLASAFRRGVN